MLLKIFNQIWSNFNLVIRRFPLAVLCALVACIAMIKITHIASNDEEKIWIKLTLISLITLPALITIVQMFSNYKSFSILKTYVFQLLVIGAVSLFIFNISYDSPFFDNMNAFRITCIVILFLLSMFWLVFEFTPDRQSFYTYSLHVIHTVIISIFFTLLLTACLEAALWAIDELFDVNLNSKYYADLFIALLTFFGPMYFMGNLKSPNQVQNIDQIPWKPYLIITKYVMIPVSILYILILYSYGIKILVQWDLPKGWVSYLCLTFSLVGLITFLLNEYFEDLEEYKLADFFKKYFMIAILPIICLLFVGIGRRILDYGLTVERIVVLSSGLLLLTISLYYQFKSRTIHWIPKLISLFVFFMLCFAIPIGNGSQTTKLISIISQHSSIQNLQKADNEIKMQVNSITEYLFSHGAKNNINAVLQQFQIDAAITSDSMEHLYAFQQKLVGNTYDLVASTNLPTVYNIKQGLTFQIGGFKTFTNYEVYPENEIPNTGPYLLKDASQIYWNTNNLLTDSLRIDSLQKILNAYQVSKNLVIPDSTIIALHFPNNCLSYIKHVSIERQDTQIIFHNLGLMTVCK